MSAFDTLPNWTKDSDAIAGRIAATSAPFKIVLKVKDDVFFLKRWIDYHAAIVGIENLVVFDNMSEDEELAEIYASYGEALTVVRFGGFHNDLHRTEKYPALYAALRASSRYFQFLDCDEFLVRIDRDHRVETGAAMVDTLRDLDAPVVPAAWLENVQGFDDRFWWDLKQGHPYTNLRSGKPIVRSSAAIAGMMNHNRQIDAAFYAEPTISNFFVLHFKRLSTRQRVDANLRKLHAYNAFKGSRKTVDEVLELDADAYPEGNKRNWIKEVQRLAVLADHKDAEPADLRAGMVGIVEGAMVFSTDDQRDTFDAYLTDPRPFLDKAMTSQ